MAEVSENWSYIAGTLDLHMIVAVSPGKQGAGQIIPEDMVLDGTCGWMRVSDYHFHIVDTVDAYITEVL